jgi:aminopeptidase YwaD
MKKLLVIVALVPVLCFSQGRKERKAQEKNDKITLANLQAHVQFLADDKLEGRRAGTHGEELAMQYIVSQFKKDGLQPKGTNDYIQEFDIDEGKKFSDADNTFTVNDAKLQLQKDYYPFAFSANASAEGSAAMALQEKGEPWFFDVKYVLDDNKSNPHFDINEAIHEQAKQAKEKGATALIVFNSTSAVDNIQFNKNDTSFSSALPVVYLTKDGQKNFFADSSDTYNIKLKVSLTHATRKAHNVVGFINFNAPATVILGAHYDHVGYGEDGNALDTFHQIHNGADDNASGTAALIELARILAKTKAHRNNYLFIAFSGEELGDLGSAYWLKHPSVNVTANYMINMDMIGRYDSSRKLTIGGFGTSPVWGDIFKSVTDNNLAVKFDSSGMGPSDHASFYKNDIPVLFFFTNGHSDYHKITDDANKINYVGELEIVNYINKIIEATDSKGKLPFTKTRDLEMRPVSLPVTLGIMPDYGFTGTGLRVDAVSKGKIAERIGLQAGDVLLQLGDYKFVDIQTYMQALQHFKKGESTTLRLKRGDKEMDFAVQF